MFLLVVKINHRGSVPLSTVTKTFQCFKDKTKFKGFIHVFISLQQYFKSNVQVKSNVKVANHVISIAVLSLETFLEGTFCDFQSKAVLFKTLSVFCSTFFATIIRRTHSKENHLKCSDTSGIKI